jgi:hypothetical protein
VTIAQEKQIFLSALDYESQAERDAYLAQACGDDAALRRAIEALLAAHERGTNVLDHPLEAPVELRRQLDGAATLLTGEVASEPATDRTGEQVGRYRLLEKIGEGGFGQVYVAQQDQPVRRRVAVKVLKRGMDSNEILGRFEAERQALALMEHPNIARVFDAGSTSSGQPFFAMELVRGVPITEFCEQQRLDVRQRLELFIDVCQAVQHAHQKGVIHRDLKPSNVLVTLHDARPVAKVIDFGVAKAIGDPLTDKTVYTRFMQMIGTPMYMSPEQAEMNSLDIDTRCDVFSLGMLLYELLTGTTPYDGQRLNTVSYDELRRIIREEELPRPSLRVSTLAQRESTASAARLGSPMQLRLALRGDLDWIVMKAVEKDRTRRYDSAGDLARDLYRYLANEPIEARPPSNWYRFSKFARRHRGPLVAGVLVLAALLLGTGVSVWQATRAMAERDEKELAREDAVRARREVEEFADRLKDANTLLASGRAHADAGRWKEAAAEFDRAVQLQPTYYHVWLERGTFYIRLGLWNEAAADYAEALELAAPVSGAEWWGGPQLMLFAGDVAGYHVACRRMWNESAQDREQPSTWAVRSCLFGSQDFIAPQEIATIVERMARRAQQTSNAKFPLAEPARPSTADVATAAGEPAPAGERKRNRSRRPVINFSGIDTRTALASHPRGVAFYLEGLAHYRSGDYVRAVDELRSATTADPKWAGKAIGHPALAMAYLRSGRPEEARKSLATANRIIEDWQKSMLEGSLGSTPVPWFDFIECLLLHREATRLITGSPPVADPLWTRLEDRAREAIR